MMFLIGTTSTRKIETVKKVVGNLSTKSVKINAHPAVSGVSETPWGKETYEGARNRALDCKTHGPSADFYVGIESGLVERYGHIYEEAWCCVINASNIEYFGYSSGLKVPDYLLNKMKEHKLPHYLIFAQLNNHLDKDINSDTWAQYSGSLIVREISIEEAVRNALVQIFSPKESYYHMK